MKQFTVLDMVCTVTQQNLHFPVFPNHSRASSADELRLSQSLPTSSFFAPPPAQRTRATPPSTPQRRGDFTRAEYERRHQLKIMSDLDKVLRQKPATSKQHKQQQQQQQQHKQQQQQQHRQQQHKHRGNKSRDNNAIISPRSPAKATKGNFSSYSVGSTMESAREQRNNVMWMGTHT